MLLYKKIAKLMSGLDLKLRQAKIPESSEDYVKKTFLSSVMLSLMLCFIGFMFTKSFKVFLFSPILFLLVLFYMVGYADAKIQRVKREISREIVYAGRFLIIELESGVPIYDSFKNLGENYEAVGKYFSDIIQDVNLGNTLEDALNNAIVNTPSPELRKILWQVLNSLKTGANVTHSLNAVLDQIVREQQIEVKEYGRKLNPIAMFYMMMAIIIPSLGTTMVVIIATFVGFTLPLAGLLVIVGILAFFQFMFLAFIKSSRPPMAL